MTPDLMNNIYINGGLIACITVAFFAQNWYNTKRNEKREDRLYSIIDILTAKLEVLPHLVDELKEIKEQLKQK